MNGVMPMPAARKIERPIALQRRVEYPAGGLEVDLVANREAMDMFGKMKAAARRPRRWMAAS